MVMWVGIIGGIVVPIVIYVMNYVRFGQKKQALEREIGMEIPTNWKKHSGVFLFNVYLYAIILQIGLLAGAHWIHPDFELATYLLVFIQTVFLGMPYTAIKAMTSGFYLTEFLNGHQLTLWYEDEKCRRGRFWMNECEHWLNSEIKNGDYLPLILNTIPLIEYKRQYMKILSDLSKRPLSAYEEEIQSSTVVLLSNLEDDLDERWQELLIALGKAERPEVLDKRKAESVQSFEQLVSQTPGVVQKQADPALKELYALTQNEEAPDDLKELAKNAIRDIETKLETESRKEKDEAIRRSAEAVIHTSRQYHGLEA